MCPISGEIINSVEKALSILDIFIESKEPLSVTEVSRMMQMNFSTTHRLVNTLWKHGYLKKDPVKKTYYLGLKALQLGLVAQETYLPLIETSKPYMEKLVARVNEDIYMGILDNNQIVYIAGKSSTHSVRTVTRLGNRAPLYCSSGGKILLSDMDPGKAKAMVDELGWKRRTKNTITGWDRMSKELEDIRIKGYSIDREELTEGVACVGAPIRNFTGKVVASISLTGLAKRVLSNLDVLTREITSTAKKISREMGYND